MFRLSKFFCLLSLILLTAFSYAAPDSDVSFKDQVVVVQIGDDSLLSKQSFAYMTRIIKKAESEKAKAVILDLDTPGGLATDTSDMMIKVLEPLKIPTFAYVNPKAMSAGALIAGACDTIYMAPTSSIGAAGIISSTGEIEEMTRKKLESAFTAYTRSVVEKKGYNKDLFEAMMIPVTEDTEFNDRVIVKKGRLLTLTQAEATSPGKDGKPLLAKGIAKDINDLLAQENIDAPVYIASPTTLESIAMWVGLISPVLILLIIGGIYFEMKTPGFGIGGIVAIAAFSVFFFGNYVAGNLAGYEMAALFVLGVLLILVEIFVVPGTFIAGIAGAALVLFSLFAGMISGASWDYITTTGDWSFDALFELILMPLVRLSLGLAGATVLIMLMIRYLPETALFRRIANEVISGGSTDGEAVGEPAPLDIGSIGISSSELKPNGKAMINGQIYEVFSRSGVLPKGTPIRVIEKRSFDFVVEQTSLDDLPPKSSDNTQHGEP